MSGDDPEAKCPYCRTLNEYDPQDKDDMCAVVKCFSCFRQFAVVEVEPARPQKVEVRKIEGVKP